MDIYTCIPGKKATGKQIFLLLVSKVVDSQQWRISPNNGGQFLTRCSRFDFKVTYYCSNDLKLHMAVNKSLYYDNLLPLIINFLLFSCSGTPKSAKLPQGWQFLFIF